MTNLNTSDEIHDFTAAEYMIVNMARMLSDADNAFMGVASNIPFFAIWLAKEIYNPGLEWLNIPGRVNPKPSMAPKSTVDFQFLQHPESCLTLADIFDMAARGELDVSFLSGVQIDRFGNFNLSHIPDKDRVRIQFTGGAGSALLCANTRRVIFWRTRHDKRSFVNRCSVVTASGNIYKVVSPLAIFNKKDGVLNLESVNPHSGFKEVSDSTDFPLNEAPFTERPTVEELETLRQFDRDNIRDIEF